LSSVKMSTRSVYHQGVGGGEEANHHHHRRRSLRQVLAELPLAPTLRERIHITNDAIIDDKIRKLQQRQQHTTTSNGNHPGPSPLFILYLPTVVLRHEHNPALAVACHLANYYHVPLLILCVVLDDAHHRLHPPTTTTTTTAATTTERSEDADATDSIMNAPIVATARRCTFVLQALQAAALEWHTAVGAGVLVRVHGPRQRTPHHLTWTRQALAVVQDEGFVYPYRALQTSVEAVARDGGTATLRVDGSTTVPPIVLLQRCTGSNTNNNNHRPDPFDAAFVGVPPKAWMWKKKTDPKRQSHVLGAVKEGHLDAPELHVKCPRDLFSSQGNNPLLPLFPTSWMVVDGNDQKHVNVHANDEVATTDMPERPPAPGKRPWTLPELLEIDPPFWTMHCWPGVDTSVPPCPQTHGAQGIQRWDNFRQSQRSFTGSGNMHAPLLQYAQRRNDIRHPHAVSRMSCYLNLGTVSIFRIVYDIWQVEPQSATEKFQEEIIKWREMSYAHAFASSDYFAPSAIPAWSRQYLQQQRQQHQQQQQQQLQQPRSTRRFSSSSSVSTLTLSPVYTVSQLAEAQTGDATWNAMQRYLVTTGELHNHARMTWGKQLVHWQAPHVVQEGMLLQQLSYLNDRYALDGLSPPSYAGLLWCCGWCDEPVRKTRGVAVLSHKPTSRYRYGPEAFAQAQQRLLSLSSSSSSASSSVYTELNTTATTITTTTTVSLASSSSSSSSLRSFWLRQLSEPTSPRPSLPTPQQRPTRQWRPPFAVVVDTPSSPAIFHDTAITSTTTALTTTTTTPTSATNHSIRPFLSLRPNPEPFVLNEEEETSFLLTANSTLSSTSPTSLASSASSTSALTTNSLVSRSGARKRKSPSNHATILSYFQPKSGRGY